MAPYHLVVSNPPHRHARAAEVAPLLALTPTEMRGKTAYPVPEIWHADVSAAESEETLQILRNARFSVLPVTGPELAKIPPQEPAQSFSFGPGALLVRSNRAELELPYDQPLVAVYGQPQQHDARADRDTVAHAATNEPDARDREPFLDLYAAIGGRVRRVSIFQNAVDSSDTDGARAWAKSSMPTFLAEFSVRFTRATIDKRLVGIKVRQRRLLPGRPEGQSRRRGYSYATKALGTLLELISPTLRDLSQNDLSSRLVYLSKQQEETAATDLA